MSKIRLVEDQEGVYIDIPAGVLPDVAEVPVAGGTLLCIGSQDIEHGYGGEVSIFDRAHYESLLIESVAALRFYDQKEQQ